jgi:hypothetical protein
MCQLCGIAFSKFIDSTFISSSLNPLFGESFWAKLPHNVAEEKHFSSAESQQ